MATIFVGPWCAGKTTWGRQYADATRMPFLDLDTIASGYGAELGWSVEKLIRRNGEIGMLKSEHEWEPVRAYIVERVLRDWGNARAISFGASYTGYTDSVCEDRVRQALSGHTVVLVCPSTDDSESARICWERAVASRGQEWADQRADFASWTPTSLDREVADAVLVTSREGLQVEGEFSNSALIESLNQLG